MKPDNIFATAMNQTGFEANYQSMFGTNLNGESSFDGRKYYKVTTGVANAWGLSYDKDRKPFILQNQPTGRYNRNDVVSSNQPPITLPLWDNRTKNWQNRNFILTTDGFYIHQGALQEFTPTPAQKESVKEEPKKEPVKDQQPPAEAKKESEAKKETVPVGEKINWTKML